jgi:hypothetical protein
MESVESSPESVDWVPRESKRDSTISRDAFERVTESATVDSRTFVTVSESSVDDEETVP